MDFLMLRETECCGLLNHQGAFESWSCVLGFFFFYLLHRTSEKGERMVTGIRFLLCSPMLFGVSGMLAGVR